MKKLLIVSLVIFAVVVIAEVIYSPSSEIAVMDFSKGYIIDKFGNKIYPQ